jgi:PAS domain S-box-containing protein
VDLFKLNGLNLVLDLTQDPEVERELYQAKPPGCSIINQTGAWLLVEMLENKNEKAKLEESVNFVFQHLRSQYQRGRKDQTTLDSLPYRIMIVNMDMTIDTVNQTFLNEYGLVEEEVLGRPCYEVRYGYHRPCQEQGLLCFLEESRRRKTVFAATKEYKDENGQTRYDEITVAPIMDEDGQLVQLLEASRDVTETHQLEMEAHQSSTFLQNVIQSAVDGIVVVDTKGKVLLFNEGMERLTGYSSEEIMNHGHLSSFYNIDVARENMRKMRSGQHGPPGKLNPTSMFIETVSGEQVPVTLSASIIVVDGKEIGSVGVFTDMREIEGMRKALDEAHLQLVQSEKIASVGRMAAGVAHEINNPLSIILIYAEILEGALHGEPSALPDVREIITQTLRCKVIVSDLLEFSRKSVGEVSAFSLGRLLDQCLNLLINLASFHNIEVRKQIDYQMPEIIGDMGQLEQVFTNLFTNAADAMEGKGSLTIQVEYDQEKDRFLTKVSDTGPGIPAAVRDKVFDIFFTTKPSGSGTGLGLSISKNIIESHGGTIRIECPPGGGTTFIVELPRQVVEYSKDEPVFIGMDEI